MKLHLCNHCKKLTSSCKCEKSKSNLSKVFLILFSLLFISIVTAITITEIQPVGDITTSNSSQIIEINISAPEGIVLNNTIWHWNGVNYTLWNGLVGWWQMNNFSSLGENDTHVYDVSGNGNNGTVIGGENISWSPSGKYGGAYRTNGLNGAYINTSTFLINNRSLSVSFWVINYGNTTDDYAHYWMIKTLSQNTVLSPYRYKSGTMGLNIRNATLTPNDLTYGSSFSTDNIWKNIVIVYDSNYTYSYENGVLYATSSGSNRVTGELNGSLVYMQIQGKSTSTGNTINGSVDDIMIFNRSLSANEIKQLYYSSLTKYDSQNWSLNINQTLGSPNSTATSIVFHYYICSSNSTNEVCSAQRTINQTIPNKVLIANFTSNVGNIRSDFYGVGLQSSSAMFSGSVDTNCDGTAETLKNYEQNKFDFLNGGNKITYYDATLQSYYNGLYNLDFEEWSNYSIGFKNSSTSTGAKGWSITIGNSRNATIYNSTDTHSGIFALQINSSSGTGNVYTYNRFNGVIGKNYTFSIWLKGQGTITQRISNSSVINKVSKSITLTSTWTQYNVSYLNIENNQSFYALLDLDNQNNITIDDFQIYEDGIQLKWWRTGNLTSMQNQLNWDYQNGITDILILDYMPSFLANRSLTKCVSSISDTDDSDCMYIDKQTWNEITIDYYKTVDQGRNRSYIQIWNEPYGSSFEDNLTTRSAKIDFVTLFNDTYNNFKDYNTNIKIIGYRDTSLEYFGSSLTDFTKMMLSNLSNEFLDGFSFHPYADNYINYYPYSVSDAMRDIFSNISSYGGSTSYLSLDEWQPSNDNIQNGSNGQSNEFKINIAIFYEDVLNHYPANASLMYYHWDDSYSYFNCPSRYSEYPSFWSGVSEAGLDNPTKTYYPPYNVTKSFATRHRVGDNVVNSTSNNGLKLVCSKSIDNLQHACTVINTNTYSVNVSNLTIYGDTITSFKDQNNNIYQVTSGVVNLGIMDSYQEGGSNNILYLTSDLQPPTITIQSPTSSTYSTTTIYFNLTLDEEGDVCVYSLDNFNTNYSMTKQGWVNEFKANKNLLIESGNSNVNFSCNDTYGNVNKSSANLTTSNNQTWISSKESIYLTDGSLQKTTYKLSSNLSSSVNVSLILTNPCPSSSTYISNSGDTSYSPSYTCSNNLIYLDVRDYEPANNSNVLELVYTNYVTPPPTSSVGSPSIFNQTNVSSPQINATEISNTLPNKIKDTVDNIVDGAKGVSQAIWNKFSGIENRNIILIVTGIIIFLVIFITIIVALVNRKS